MGRRSRKRSGAAAPSRPGPARAAPGPARPSRPLSAGGEERPRAPWHPVPVTEIGIALGLLAALVGFIRGPRATVPMLVGLGVCAVLAFELAAREHFAGFRSHALMLAAGPTVLLEALLYGVGLRGPVLLAVAAPVFVALAFALRSRWRDASELRSLRR